MEPMAFDGGLLFWTLLTFACLMAVLARFAFRPLRKVLEQRELAIRDSLEKAAQARQEARNLLALNDRKLAEAKTEARKIVDEGQQLVAAMKHEVQQNARREADVFVNQARADIDRELQKSLTDLKETVANLSVRIARQVIKEGLDEKRHQELADDFIERLKSHATRPS